MSLGSLTFGFIALVLLAGPVDAQQITTLVPSSSDANSPLLEDPFGIVIDSVGNVYVIGNSSNNVVKISPGGSITEFWRNYEGAIDRIGAGTFAFDPNFPSSLDPTDIVIDSADNLYVLFNEPVPQNVTKLTPNGVATKLIDSEGDGQGNFWGSEGRLAIDPNDNLYVSGGCPDNVFRIAPSGSITALLDNTSIPPDQGEPCDNAFGAVAVSNDGLVYVAATNNDGIVRVTQDGASTQFTDGQFFSGFIFGIEVDPQGNVYVVRDSSPYLTRSDPNGTTEVLIDPNFAATSFSEASSVALDDSGNVYVTVTGEDHAFQIAPDGAITDLIDANGDGAGNILDCTEGIVVDDEGLVYVAGLCSNSVFRIDGWCGDGVTQSVEECDDGNLNEGDGCDSNCTVTACGNGIISAGEQCDDQGESAGCNADCTLAGCGDGVLNTSAGEGCDDGNLDDGDGCDSNCTVTACGNGIVSAGEQCDDGGESVGCNADCTLAECGDGTLNTAAGEGCDDGNLDDGDGCDSNCTVTACGNGILTAAEECEDGNLNDGDGCDSNCRFSSDLISGTRLFIRDKEGDPTKRKIVLRSRDPGVLAPATGSAGDPRFGGGVLEIFNPTTQESDSFALPANSWSLIGSPAKHKGFIYLDRGQTNGPCKRVVIKSALNTRGLVQASCQGDQISFTLDEPSQGSVGVRLSLGDGTSSYCLLFGGSVKRDRPATSKRAGFFFAINSPRPSSCPSP